MFDGPVHPEVREAVRMMTGARLPSPLAHLWLDFGCVMQGWASNILDDMLVSIQVKSFSFNYMLISICVKDFVFRDNMLSIFGFFRPTKERMHQAWPSSAEWGVISWRL
jgi:hypothetical protein